jgi:hypothetical protein
LGVKEQGSGRDAVLRPLDIALTVAILLAAGLSAFHLYWKSPSQKSGSVAQIDVDGETVCSLALGENRADTSFELSLPRGKGTIEVSGGRIRILAMPDSVCPLHICSRTGWIERPGQFIACVPNRLIITIHRPRGALSDSLDAVTY